MLDSLQLSKKVIDLDELRMLAAQGVPDVAGVRSTVWKVLDWLAFCVFLAFVVCSMGRDFSLKKLIASRQ